MISMKRMGLKLFSLCVLALGLVAFSATAAQAEGTWMVKTVDLTTIAKNKQISGKFETGTDGTLLANLGLNKVNFLCTSTELLNAFLEPEGKISENNKNAKVDFSGCTTIINGTTAPKCIPLDGINPGVILTEEGYALLQLHTLKDGVTKDAVTVITPNNAGKVFAVIHMGEACAIGEEVKVFGSLALVDVGGNTGTLEEKQIHVVQEFKELTELKVANSTSSGTATLDGKAEIELVSHEVWNGLYK
jgi:hypothetical protein